MTQRNLVHGIPTIKHATQICDVCLIRKHSRKPFLKKAKARSTSPLDLVYGDLCGPITPPTPSGKKYIFLIVDDYSRYMWVYFLSTKDQAFDTFKEYKSTIEKELRTTLKMLRTDRGEEFTQYCKENGITRQLTAPYSPQQNGVVERRNRTIMSTTRCMMKATNIPQNFWAEAVRHAIYILNSIPTKALEDVTPYEAIKQKKPNLENLKVFGCIAYAKIPSQHLTKLDDRSTKMVYLGNEQGSKAYRLFDPTTRKICVSRDVKIRDLEAINEHHDQGFQPIEEDNEFPNNDDDDYVSPTRDSPLHSQNLTHHLQGYRTLNDIYENTEELLLAEDEPKNYKEASNDQKWIEAMKVELDSINRNNTWVLTTLPTGHKAIGLKWVFKTKKDANGNIIKHKARLNKDYGITYKHNGGNTIQGFSDSSYGVNTQKGKGTTGIIFYYGDSPISWSTQKQATVALSSCESEFIAATAAATQALWLKRLLSRLTHSKEEKITIMVDNKSAITLMKNPIFHGRSKHIDTKYHFIREYVEREDIQVKFISGEY
ncbi:zinc finger, CCHC-type containing protein [Tanacetum coccineum]